MGKRANVVGWVGLGLLSSCSSSEPPSPVPSLASSPQATALLTSLRTRFVLPPVAPPQRPEGLPSDLAEPEPAPRTLFPHGSSEGFDRSGDRLTPRLRIASSVKRPASVTLPVRANGGFEVKDTTSGLRLAVKLRGTTSADAEEADGNVVYRGGYRGQGAVIHRPHAEGTEDFVLLEHEPEDHALVYEVDVRGVAGLRLTSNVLEFLNAAGDPRLRMTAPLAVDAKEKALGLRVSVKGCAVDEKEALPWGREVVPPGAERCEVRVEWEGGRYPLVVDPAWTSTGNLAVGRYQHTASMLSEDRVLVIGGYGNDVTSCPNSICKLAEMWQNGSFSNVGVLTVGRGAHTASRLSGDRVLVVGGSGNDATNCPNNKCKLAEMWQNGSFSNAGILTVGRQDHTASVLPADRVLVVGGNGNNATKSAEMWENGSFTSAGSLAVGRSRHTASVLSGDRVLIVGGYNQNDSTNCPNFYCKPAEVWGSGSFSSAGSLTAGRDAHTASVLSADRVLIVGGYNNGEPTNCPNNVCQLAEMWQSDSFFSVGNSSVRRYDHTASVLSDDSVLVVGGCHYQCPSEMWQIGFFFNAGSPKVDRSRHTASVLSGDRVLILGGENGNDVTNCPNQKCKLAEVWEKSASDLGNPCTNNLQCSSEFCVEGVCCDFLCSSPCLSCLASRKIDASSNGFCGPILVDTDPKKACPKKASNNACDVDDLCDGQGACKAVWAPKDTLCGAASCSPDNTAIAGSACNESGTCQADQTVSCQGFLCTNGSCPTFCFNNANCAPGFSCSGNKCLADNPLSNSEPCTFGAQCASGFCSDSLCAEFGAGGTGGAGTAGMGGAGTGGNAGLGGLSGASGQGGTGGNNLSGAGQGGGGAGGAGQGGAGQAGSGQGGSAAGASGASSLPPGSLGAPCSSSAQCNAFTCVDGVCCESSCSGPCLACSTAKKGTGLDGLCGPVAAGTDPDNECTQGAKHPDDCSADGMCDGQGACRTKAPETTACGVTTCIQGVVEGELCSAAGVCKTAKADCAPFKCAGSQCASSCVTNGECAQGAYCNTLTKRCEEIKEQGSECAYDGQCKTGHCADGVCCSTACQGQCESCAQAGSAGQCKPTPTGQQPAGARMRCDEGPNFECHGACDGGDRTACKYPGTTTLCNASTCVGSTFSPVVCDGQGSCKPEPSRDCEALLCDETAGRCKTTCSGDDDCIPGATCNKATGVCTSGGASCADDFTAKTASGTLVSCKGRCLAGQCQESCGISSDCAKGYTCLNNTCVSNSNGVGGQGGTTGGAGAGGTLASPASAASEEGGCGCSTPRQRTPARGLVVVVALGLALSRRRRVRASCGLL